jgi:hypothetical protein
LSQPSDYLLNCPARCLWRGFFQTGDLCVHYLKISFYEPISCRTRLSIVVSRIAGDQANEKKKARMDDRRCSHIKEACGQKNAGRKNRPDFEADRGRDAAKSLQSRLVTRDAGGSRLGFSIRLRSKTANPPTLPLNSQRSSSWF